MIESNLVSSSGIVSRRFVLRMFTLTSILFILSWFFVLRSTNTPPSLDRTTLISHPSLQSVTLESLKTKASSQKDILESVKTESGSHKDILESAKTEPSSHKDILESDKTESSSHKDILESAKTEPSSHKDIDPSVKNRSILNDNNEEIEESKDSLDSDTQCPPNNKTILKVYMYDLPPEFHFELLDWKSQGQNGNSVWPDVRSKFPSHPGGLNLQHSIEYWLTLDLLDSQYSNSTRSAVRVLDLDEADVVFVPFFSSLSYNRFSKVKPGQRKSMNVLLQEKLVRYLMNREEWKRSGGRDHVVPAHHPNSMLQARRNLSPAMFILSDFGRYPPNIANIDKDVIAPYKHVVKSFDGDESGFRSRPTLLFFQGAIQRKAGGFIRHELYNLLKNEKDVHFSSGSVQRDGVKKATEGMRSSKFCLNIAGDTPSSNRLFDAISSHCIPVIISDEIELPYEDVLDYSKFCIFVKTSDALKRKFLVNYIRGIKEEEWTVMWESLKEVESFYEFQYPSKEGDAVQMIWQAIARKAPAMHRKLHRLRRFSHHGGRDGSGNVGSRHDSL